MSGAAEEEQHRHDHEHGRGHMHDPAHGREHDHSSGNDRDGRAPARALAGLVHFLRSAVGAHSHSPEDSVDRALETSERGIRALKLSLLGLGATALFQLTIVLASGSVALLADTVHNFSDALTAIPLWIAFAVGRRAANSRYTYGYGRAEDLAGLFVLAMIALSAAVAGWESVQRLLHPQTLENVGWVLLAGLIGFIGNEAVAYYRIRVGKEIGSAALIADGYHARADGLTSLAVVFGGLGVLAGYPVADPVVGLAITVAILFVLRDAGRRVLHRLMDAVEPELTETARGIVAATPGVETPPPPDVRIRWVGHQLWADVEVIVNSERSLTDAHAIAEEARHRLLHDVPRLAQVHVHVDPCTHAGADHHASTAHHFSSRPATRANEQLRR
ncbi:MAG TPA: cation diffusion facilitator family transporter [Candidatus Limnocylindria bacterium]|nr:cation diffusion facilitator family transporter [Candidatus Limnocylindria bacterium]